MSGNVTKEPLRVLLVEDSENDALILLHALARGGYDVTHHRVQTEVDLRAALAIGPWDIVISDYRMPGFSGARAAEITRDSGLDLPFIVISGTVGEETAVEVLKAGAHDFLLKGRLARLIPAIERERREARLRRERREALAQVQYTARHLDAIFRQAAVGIAEVDLDGLDGLDGFTGAIRSVNQRFCDIVGRPEAALLGTLLHDLAHPDDRAASLTLLDESRPGVFRGGVELRCRRGDGSLVWVDENISVVADETGRPRYAIVVMQDITARKSAEEDLRRTGEQLRHAQKMEAIGRLAGSIAHDFNNLLSVILSYSEMLLEELKQVDPIRNDIESIRKAGQRAAELTQQLLAFSRQQVIAPRPFDLNQAVAESQRMLGRLLGEDIHLVTLREPRLARVKVDPGQIDQIIMNLAINARDAMPDGGKLTIETQNVVLDESYAEDHLDVVCGPHVMLAISDTGSGMDKETQGRIFEPFFTTKEKGKGTGLGLSTVFGIVKQSNGHIWVYSEPGKGTTFKIYLPVTNERDEPAPEVVEPLTLTGTETILLTEDQDEVRQVAREILRRFGYHVLEARNAGEALLTCERHPLPIHLLLTDVVMPQMSGRELAKRLVSIRPDMRVLYMSGYTDNAIVHHGILDPHVAYLQKPLVPEALGRRVREVLDAPPRKGPAPPGSR